MSGEMADSAHFANRREDGGGSCKKTDHCHDKDDDTTTHMRTSLSRLLLPVSNMRRDRLSAVSAVCACQTQPSVMTPDVAALWS